MKNSVHKYLIPLFTFLICSSYNYSQINDNAVLESETLTVGASLNKISFDYLNVYLIWEDGTTDKVLIENVNKIIFDLTSSVKNKHAEEQINIYPNPGTDAITIVLNNKAEKLDVTIFNVNGQIVFASTNHSLNEKINIGSFKPGIYFVKINSEIFKITKQ